MRRLTSVTLAVSAATALAIPLTADKLTYDDRVELIRGLTAEYATVKDFLPRSKKPLEFESTGKYDQKHWAEIGRDFGPAARVGDLVQITKVTIEDEKILLEINGGLKKGGHWYDHVEVGMGNRTNPVSNNTAAGTTGTYIEVLFHKPLEPMKASEVKKMLAPLFDFEKHSATQLYAESLSPETRKAIDEKRAEEGMDRDQVLLALGRPDRKVRETKDGLEMEDWIFGRPPGKIVFVTFNGTKVVKVKESYAGLGAEAAAPLQVPR
ncbi:MAG: hypothetical protein ACR2I2_13880 [Bryobacteraceae bacterium]